MQRRTAVYLAVWMVLLVPHSLSAFTLEAVELRSSVLWIGSAFQETESGVTVQGRDVSPLRFSPGVSARLRRNENLVFSPGLDFYYQEYLAPDMQRYGDDPVKVVPNSKETGSAAGDIAGTLGVILSFPFGWEFQLGDSWAVTPAFSPTLAFRIPLFGIDGGDTDPVLQHFFLDGRFLYPEPRLRVAYNVSEQLELGILLRGMLPIYNLWISEPDVAFWDEMMLSLSAGVVFMLDSE
ncbi:MAG: hypothetical protein LC641_11285 [Spirochaeta sp.]|nr:hypothetical protein [Spirochaeta sp.]